MMQDKKTVARSADDKTADSQRAESSIYKYPFICENVLMRKTTLDSGVLPRYTNK